MKKLLILFSCLFLMLSLISCRNSESMDSVIANEQSVTGIVQEWSEREVLVELQGDDYKDGSLCYVSLDVQNKDSVTHFDVGDEIVIYYDGSMQETYPMQINTVYAITLRTPAKRTELSDITIQQAEEIALEDAGLERSDVKYINSYDEYKDHEPYSYEVEFGLRGDTQYHYSILIETGEILEKRVEEH